MADKKENCNVPNKIEDRYGIAEYAKLIQAFDFFNEKLFGKRLPDVMFTIARHRGANGYFWQDAFQERKFENDDRLAPGFFVHEIAIMPDAMHCRPDRDVLSTLVHEMAHLEQAELRQEEPQRVSQPGMGQDDVGGGFAGFHAGRVGCAQ